MSDPAVEQGAADPRRVTFPGTDLEVIVSVAAGDLAVNVTKSGKLVYRVVIEQATGPIDSAWIVDLFTRSDRVCLADLSADVEEYLESLNIAQG